MTRRLGEQKQLPTRPSTIKEVMTVIHKHKWSTSVWKYIGSIGHPYRFCVRCGLEQCGMPWRFWGRLKGSAKYEQMVEHKTMKAVI